MRIFFKIVWIALLGILALGAVVAGLAYYNVFSVGPSNPIIGQTSAPITREEAIKRCPIPLPESAQRIQYFSISYGMMGEKVFVRFEAPVADCYACAKLLFERFAYDRAHHFPTFQPISRPESMKQRIRVCPQWFDLDRESEWVVAGKGVSGEPKIWIDTKSGVFYCFKPSGID
jgi:hypothetical protein